MGRTVMQLDDFVKGLNELSCCKGCPYGKECKENVICDIAIRNSIQTIRRCQKQNEQLVR